MTPDSLKLVLGLEPRSKAIPYPAEDREDGTKNTGFRDLKGAEADVFEIPEAQDSPALRNAILSINHTRTPFFTVACEKALTEHDGQYWKRGFLEFSYNYAEYVTDAAAYFPLFFHFSRASHEFVSQREIQFFWELQGAHYTKIDKGGFSCAAWITSGGFDTAKECEAIWDEAVSHLAAYLVSIKPQQLTLIYGPGS